jgi:homoserine O-acetyltransferase
VNAEPIKTPKDCEAAHGDIRDVSIVLPRDFVLASGEKLSRPEIALRLHGDPSRPAVAVSGGISSGRAAADAAGEKGWWRDIAAAGGAVDLNRFCVIGFDFLPNPSEMARTISTDDQARAVASALDALKIDRLYAFVGASYGGMVALAFAALFPGRVEKICVISAATKAHPVATAYRGVQRRILEFAMRCGAAQEGVSLARQLAMITYRTADEFAQRFETKPGPKAGDLYPVCEYLSARGAAFPMNAERYLTLSDSIDRHNADPALIKAKTLLIGVRSDRLVPLEDMRRLSAEIDQAKLAEIDSLYGHDAFLKEAATMGPLIREFLQG